MAVPSENDTGIIGSDVGPFDASWSKSLRAQLLPLLQFLKPELRIKLRLLLSTGLFLSIALLIFFHSKISGLDVFPTVPKNGDDPLLSVWINST